MHKQSLISVVLGVAITSIAMGCGGGGTPALSKAEVIKQGDAICEKADAKQEAGINKYGKEHPKGQFTEKGEQEKLVRVVGLPPILMEAEELRDLSAPEGQQDEIEAIATAIESAVEKGESNPSSILNGEGPFSKADKLAREYGFKACAAAS